jgi:CYTH domain-containing protein
MGLEIEHKYLVRKDLWYAIQKPEGVSIRQGYLYTDSNKTIRIRIAGEDAFITIKGPSNNATRVEFEYPIPIIDAEELMRLCTLPLIDKIRYHVEFAGKRWDVDEFFGENEGLIMAEIELIFAEEKYEMPAWVGNDVTQDPRYYNSYLAAHSFSTWD